MAEVGKAELALAKVMKSMFSVNSDDISTEEKIIGQDHIIVRRWRAYPNVEFCLRPSRVGSEQAHYLFLRWPDFSGKRACLFRYRPRGAAESGFWIECRDLDSIREKWGERSVFVPRPSLQIVSSILARSKRDIAFISKVLGWSPEKINRVKSYFETGSREAVGNVEYSLPDWAQICKICKVEEHEAKWALSDFGRIIQDVEVEGTIDFVNKIMLLPRDCLPIENLDRRVDELDALRKFLKNRQSAKSEAKPKPPESSL